ncbi:MAG: TonB-dependent receptor plug domain-containing protein [Bacteroidales bacterium]|nr:TonB-dependent receptor plug domain-containing protein [Bacteroidales bacterium]
MKGKSLTLSLLLFILACCSPSLWAQTITVTGTVLDEADEPMIGASVKAKNAATGVSTNIDGEFRLKADEGVTIVVSYIGYNSKEFKATSQPVTIKMEPTSTALDEVVVVGVSMKKSDLTGSVAQIDGDALRERPVTTVNEALQGRVAGVSISAAQKPSDDGSIKIRGTNTYNSGSDPIYVVDGMVMSNDYSFFNSINVNDIESIQVLKDASATALYGSRGANGVVLITTKKGTSPEGQITFDGWIGIQTRASTPKRMNAQQLYELRLDAYAAGYAWGDPSLTAADMAAYRESVTSVDNLTVFFKD